MSGARGQHGKKKGVRGAKKHPYQFTSSGGRFEQVVPNKLAAVCTMLSMKDKLFPVGKGPARLGERGCCGVRTAAEETQTRDPFFMSGLCVRTIMTITDAAAVPCDQQ